jgi:hypothetical protein
LWESRLFFLLSSCLLVRPKSRPKGGTKEDVRACACRALQFSASNE